MLQNVGKRRGLLDLAACLWMVAAQIWYYSQFKEQFRSILSFALGKLWH
jgi:hypothetical protein